MTGRHRRRPVVDLIAEHPTTFFVILMMIAGLLSTVIVLIA